MVICKYRNDTHQDEKEEFKCNGERGVCVGYFLRGGYSFLVYSLYQVTTLKTGDCCDKIIYFIETTI